MADEPDTDVTIRNESTQETQVVAYGSVPFFTNSGWVALDSRGHKRAHQPTTPPIVKEV